MRQELRQELLQELKELQEVWNKEIRKPQLWIADYHKDAIAVGFYKDGGFIYVQNSEQVKFIATILQTMLKMQKAKPYRKHQPCKT